MLLLGPHLAVYPQSQRQNLPIARYRTHIIEILEHSQVLVLSGETGW